MDAEHFDTLAHYYDDTIPSHVVQHYLQKRVRFLSGLCSKGRALDVGCGTGTLAAALHAAVPPLEVSGSDDSEGMLNIAREKGVSVTKTSAHQLPFKEASFDLVYCVAVMHHIGEPDAVRKTVQEMVRVCSPGGHVVIWDHNPWNPYWKSFMKRLPQDQHVHRLVPADELVRALPANAGHTVSVTYLGWVPDFCPRFLVGAWGFLEKLLEHTPGLRRFGAHHVVVIKK